MPSYVKRPTKQDIIGLLSWCGGSLTELPYSTLTLGGAVTPQPLDPKSYGGFWGRFWWEVLRDMTFLNLEFQNELKGDLVTSFPEDFPLRLPPTGPAKVASAVDQVNVGDPQVKVTLPQGYRDPKTRAAMERLLARFLRGLIQMEEQTSDTSPLRDQSVNTIGLGMGCRMMALDMSRWPEKPKRKRGERQEKWDEREAEWTRERRRTSPFVSRSLHPMNVIYDRVHTPPEWMVIREPANPWEIRAEYPDWNDPAQRLTQSPSGPGTLPVVKTTFITKKWVAVYADGSALLSVKDGADDDGVAPNPYGLINAWPSAGGAGSQDPYGRPEYELVGIIRRNRDTLLMDASVFNQEEVIRQRSTLGPKIWVTGPDAKRRVDIARQILSNPMKAVDSEQGYDYKELAPSPIPPVLMDMRARIDQALDKGMVFDVASGSGTPSEPAARTRIRLFQIDKRFATAVLHIQQTLEASLTAALYMVKYVLKEAVGVNVALPGQPADYVDVKPDDIPDGAIVEVNLIGDSEEEKARLLQMGQSRMQTGTLDLTTFLEDFAREPDPQRIVAGLYLDKMRSEVLIPAVVALLQGAGPQMVAQAFQQQGILMQPQEVAPMVGISTGGMPGDPAAGPPGGGVRVQPQGAGLPGLPGLVPAEGGNPALNSPNGPEALAQTLNQGLPPVGRGPAVRTAPPRGL